MSLGDYLFSLQTNASALVHTQTMEFASSLFDYVNPYACPQAVFEETVLENLFLCCGFWFGYDWFTAKVGVKCGEDTVDKMEISREMFIPLMRERCPGNAHNSYGCKMLMHLSLLGLFFWFCVLIWSAVATLKWLRVRHQLRTILHGGEEPTKESLAKAFPDALKVELQPLTRVAINGHTIAA